MQIFVNMQRNNGISKTSNISKCLEIGLVKFPILIPTLKGNCTKQQLYNDIGKNPAPFYAPCWC